MKKNIISIFAFVLLSIFFISPIYAETGGSSGGSAGGSSDPSSAVIKLDNPFRTGGNLIDFVTAIINNIVLPIGGVLAVLAFIYTGFSYVMAQGDPAKIKDAHRALLYTVIGTAILLGAWLIAGVISNTVDKLKTS